VVTRVCVSVCVSVCLSAAARPHYCTDPDVTWRHDRGCPLVVHYWADLQSGHGLRCYGNITRTLVASLRPSRDMTTSCERPAGWGLRSSPAGDRRATGSAPKTAPHTGSGRRRPAGDRPPTGAFSTLLRQSGMRASTGDVLATNSERKMLASTCLYSLYAWFCYSIFANILFSKNCQLSVMFQRGTF